MKITFTLTGQIRGGKNHVMLTRSGHRYPNPVFAEWRDRAIFQIREQWESNTKGEPLRICVPCQVVVLYWAGDKRKRDVPALIDGLWHCLERGRFVEDDALLQDVNWFFMGHDKSNPRAEVEITAKEAA